ncbi:hypothetical protein IVB26_17095 [Bradyrhizobium sp. 195]|nr:hypothetical protein IVB26_17095 [Bradyrhizobium sp. 195]
MSPGLTDLFHVPTLICGWILALGVTCGPLLLEFLNYRPVTRCAVLRAVSSFVVTGGYLTIGTAAISAQESGLISSSTSILVMACLLAGAAASSFLIARWYPDEQA